MDEEYGLIVSFPDQSESFAHGVEAGMIWQRLQDGDRPESVTTRIENREVISRMAKQFGLTTRPIPTGIEGWDDTRFEPKLPTLTGGLIKR